MYADERGVIDQRISERLHAISRSLWRADATISYALTPHIEIGGNIDNLTNKRFYDYAYSEFEVWPGAPRVWRMFVRSRF